MEKLIFWVEKAIFQVLGVRSRMDFQVVIPIFQALGVASRGHFNP